MMDNFKQKFKMLYEKIKKVKHIEIYLAVGLAAIVILVYFSFIGNHKSGASSSITKNDNISANISSSQEYIDYFENKLENVITKVKGAGNVEVVISLEKGFEYIYVTEEETRTTSTGTTITTSSVVMVDGQPVIKEEIYPIIKGIVVIASGANDVSVKMNILSIIQTVIDLDTAKINIYAGN